MRIIIKLYWDIAPIACENFATLCTNGSSRKTIPIGESGKPLTYRKSIFHRIIPGFIAQGGDFVFGNGSGGECVFHGKKTFRDEKGGLDLHHDRRGLVSMGNGGRKHSNTSQFFITLAGEDNVGKKCDGKHVVFGEIVSGMEVMDAMERTVGNSEGGEGLPSVTVRIDDCGVYYPICTAGAGYWYDRSDEEAYLGYNPVFIVRPRVVILAPTEIVYAMFVRMMGLCVVPVKVVVEGRDGNGAKSSLREAVGLLEEFRVDVVLVAPVYADLVRAGGVEIPPSWVAEMEKREEGNFLGEEGVGLEEVFIIAKPVEALSKIREDSWFRRQSLWQLDGII